MVSKNATLGNSDRQNGKNHRNNGPVPTLGNGATNRKLVNGWPISQPKPVLVNPNQPKDGLWTCLCGSQIYYIAGNRQNGGMWIQAYQPKTHSFEWILLCGTKCKCRKEIFSHTQRMREVIKEEQQADRERQQRLQREAAEEARQAIKAQIEREAAEEAARIEAERVKEAKIIAFCQRNDIPILTDAEIEARRQHEMVEETPVVDVAAFLVENYGLVLKAEQPRGRKSRKNQDEQELVGNGRSRSRSHGYYR